MLVLGCLKRASDWVPYGLPEGQKDDQFNGQDFEQWFMFP